MIHFKNPEVMRKEKVREHIMEISGINTEPFNRFVGDIPVDELIKLLRESKKKCEVGAMKLYILRNYVMFLIVQSYQHIYKALYPRWILHLP